MLVVEIIVYDDKFRINRGSMVYDKRPVIQLGIIHLTSSENSRENGLSSTSYDNFVRLAHSIGKVDIRIPRHHNTRAESAPKGHPVRLMSLRNHWPVASCR
jgi:hypothetical protein